MFLFIYEIQTVNIIFLRTYITFDGFPKKDFFGDPYFSGFRFDAFVNNTSTLTFKFVVRLLY